jgi:hypothetical protein
VQHRSRLPCLTPIAGKIIYYFIFGVLGACRQAPYKFKKIVWGLLCMGTPHSEHTENR